VVLGSPGKVVRTLDPSKGPGLEKSATGYVRRAREYLHALSVDDRFA
jgi:carbonic anhydrase/acetyltransferase-like protein (isoleucine patch superfamily)